MKICLILEGSYPYVHGGVSTWMHQYITEMKDHEFVLWVVGATHEQKGKFVYELPENVVEVHEVFLDYVVPDKEEDIEPHQFTDEEKQALKDMVFCQQPDWKVLFKLLQDGKVVPNDLLSSEAFFQVLKDLCSERYTQLSFSDVFHTIRSMLFPLLNILSCPPPEADVYHSISTGYGGILATLGSLTYDKPLFLTEHGIYTREREEELLRAKWVLPTMRQQWVRFFYMLSDAIYQNAEKITSLFTNNQYQVTFQLIMDRGQSYDITVENLFNLDGNQEDIDEYLKSRSISNIFRFQKDLESLRFPDLVICDSLEEYARVKSEGDGSIAPVLANRAMTRDLSINLALEAFIYQVIRSYALGGIDGLRKYMASLLSQGVAF